MNKSCGASNLVPTVLGSTEDKWFLDLREEDDEGLSYRPLPELPHLWEIELLIACIHEFTFSESWQKPWLSISCSSSRAQHPLACVNLQLNLDKTRKSIYLSIVVYEGDIVCLIQWPHHTSRMWVQYGGSHEVMRMWWERERERQMWMNEGVKADRKVWRSWVKMRDVAHSISCKWEMEEKSLRSLMKVIITHVVLDIRCVIASR